MDGLILCQARSALGFLNAIGRCKKTKRTYRENRSLGSQAHRGGKANHHGGAATRIAGFPAPDLPIEARGGCGASQRHGENSYCPSSSTVARLLRQKHAGGGRWRRFRAKPTQKSLCEGSSDLWALPVSGTIRPVVQYEWDNGKAAENLRNMGVTFGGASAALRKGCETVWKKSKRVRVWAEERIQVNRKSLAVAVLFR